MKNPINKVGQRQKRHARTRAKMSGTKETPRLIVFRSLKYMHAQLIDDADGKTLVAAHDIKAAKGTKVEKAAAVGKEIAEKAIAAGVKKCVFDRNGYKYHGRVKALAEAAREAGLKF